ncbi:peptide-methionine (R)-S-oxide reductase MsrB [Streptococcus sp. DD13]|uniref:peptide-methionine (R)-S-oxide reductase MsrB n=1 Tax=Streptococcus sp. DD13 TaxID=1777881 RepID=UPI00079A0C88|nr:peptide-methionine (R)-S-oxide reductase MsrB [Streptococcus sp. DD13]KXT77965.1 Peptide methionine sulfoxide reductase MsrA / Peptide methionine sulfoxide reductase MsrB [Streptococcus sp. DD13]
MNEIYLAGGCFWGLEEYFSQIEGVLATRVGYANGQVETTNYELLKQTDHAETVRVTYDSNQVGLRAILLYYFRVIDPFSVNQQGADKGRQYRTGIYYQSDTDKAIIDRVVKEQEEQFGGRKLAVEVEALRHFIDAEEGHQDYLKKHPGGYCHIDPSLAHVPLIDADAYQVPSQEQLREELSQLQYAVTQEAATERPFANEFWDSDEAGLYVDVTSGEPLFLSTDKFDSGCGWPSFTRPISKEVAQYARDTSLGRERIEVRSRVGQAHLGHVFDDGPKEAGGLRYCINSAALRFVPRDQMESQGYGAFLALLERKR